jgi:hypothetical protein
MPVPKAARKPVANKTRKQTAIGSARRLAQAERAQGAGRRIARKHKGEAAGKSKYDAPKDQTTGKVAVQTPNVPGYTNHVDAQKYAAMRDVILSIMPSKAPGITQGEMFEAVRAKASNHQFPGSTDRWWAKCVQLDLEAKGVLRRDDGKPLRWTRR